MRNRLFAVLSIVIVLAMLLAGCGAKEPTAPPPYQAQPTTPPEPTAVPEPTTPPSPIGTEAQPLQMVFVPSGDTQKILAGAEQLDKLIKDKTGLVTKSSVATSYAAVIEGMGAEKIDIGWLAPLSYVLAKDKYETEVLLITLRYDSPTYKGQINVRADSGIKSIADLKGKKFAWTDPVSTSGYLYPFALFKSNGIDPTKDFAETVFTGGHTAAVLAVYNGQVDASASYDDARGTLAATYPDIKDKVTVLTYTDPIPNDTVSVRKGLPADVVAKFKQGMLDIAKTDEGKAVLQAIYEIGGLTEGNDALFDPIRTVATGLGIELANWKGASVRYLVGMVTDVGGIDDKSFNATAWKGVTDATKKMFVDGKYLESQQQSDYAKNITEFLNQKADMIVTVGFLLGVDTATAAKANPNTKFAIVDYAYPDCWPGAVVGKDCGSDVAVPNVRGLTFATDQAGFLAGYVAAATTKTGKVGTFGGMKLPTVTIFMVGYEAGVKYYNTVKGTNVQVLGWDTAKDDGLFTGNFESAEDGRKAAESLFDEGADIVMPVAGPCGLGAGAAAKERGLMVIGVDTDWYVSAPEYKETYLTSVLKNMDAAVLDTITNMTKGTFKGGTNYLGTLANKGVGIAGFHDYESKVPATLADELKAITANIVAGKIKTSVLAGPNVVQLVGMVTDVGGIDDKSFNATAWKGVTDATKKLMVVGKYLESQQQSDYAKNITEFLNQKADMIVTVGFLLGVDTATAAKANPNTKFAIVDYAYPDCWPGAAVGKDCGSDVAVPNVRGLTFATDQAGFLAGYVAAATTKTGKVGTFGGMKLPTVTIFMKGYEAGVKYHNAQKGTKVQVLGWDTAKDDGLFTGNFESAEDGRKAAESLFDEGADIVMPVAGPCGLGAGAAAKERGLMVIGVDTDWYVSAPEYKETYLTSVLKNMDASVLDTITTMADGKFKGGENYVGTLANKGVGIAGFHDYESKVPATLAGELTAITADIIAGKIKW